MAKDKQPLPVHGPLEVVVGSPYEKVGKSRFRGLGLIRLEYFPDKVSILQLNGPELWKFGRRCHGSLLSIFSLVLRHAVRTAWLEPILGVYVWLQYKFEVLIFL
jgi:hypothetical protein